MDWTRLCESRPIQHTSYGKILNYLRFSIEIFPVTCMKIGLLSQSRVQSISYTVVYDRNLRARIAYYSRIFKFSSASSSDIQYIIVDEVSLVVEGCAVDWISEVSELEFIGCGMNSFCHWLHIYFVFCI